MSIYLVESQQDEHKSYLYTFERTSDKEKKIHKIEDYYPYFYVPESDVVEPDYRIKDVESGYTSIDNEKVKRVYLFKSSDVRDVRDKFSKHYEADIPYTQRYVIDVIGEQSPTEIREFYFDIELDTEDVFPDLQNPDQAITFISYLDSFNPEPKGMIYQPKEALVQLENSDNLTVYQSEAAMLRAFLDLVEEVDPDLISGWNINGFDLPYIIRRMIQYGLEIHRLSPMGKVFIDDRYEDVTIKGRLVFDMMRAYQLFRQLTNQGKADSYSLEHTSQTVLGSGKLSHPEGFREMWIEKPDKLVEYGLRDTKLVYDINKKLEIIPFFDSIRCKACAFITDIKITSKLMDGFLLRSTLGNPVLPSKQKNDASKFSGAFVVEPEEGLFENIFALDIKAMYPNLIKTFNISYESYNPNGEITLYDDVAFDKKEGLIPRVLKSLEGERNKYKKLRKEAEKAGDMELYKFYDFRQYAVKVVSNSLYGYLGFPGARLYKKVVANAVTNMGKNLILHTKEVLENHGYKVVYGDTDSVYVQSQENGGVIDILKEGDALVDLINEAYKEFAKKHNANECTLQMEFEKVFSKIMFLEKKSGAGAKKRYAYRLLWHADKSDISGTGYTGLDLVRSDSSLLSKDIQKEVIERIMDGESKEQVVSRLEEIDLNMRSNIIDEETFGFPTGISKHLKEYSSGVPPVVRGASYSNKYLGTRFGKGSKPKWTYIKHVPQGYPMTNVLAFDYKIPEGFIPDYDKIIEKSLKNKLEQIFKAAGFGDFPILNSSYNKLSDWGL